MIQEVANRRAPSQSTNQEEYISSCIREQVQIPIKGAVGMHVNKLPTSVHTRIEIILCVLFLPKTFFAFLDFSKFLKKK